MNSDQNFVGLPDGSIVTARALVRLVPQRRWNKDLVAAITAVPMDHKTRGMDVVDIEQGPSDAEGVGAQEEQHEQARRRLKITDKDLLVHGYSLGCPRCSLHKQGQHVRARYLKHNELCRARVYEAMRITGTEKMVQADAESEQRTRIKDPVIKSGRKK